MLGRGFVGVTPFGARPFIGPWLWGFWSIALLVRLLFFGLIVYLVLRLFRGRRYAGYGPYPGRYYDDVARTDLPPAEILRRRYAAGEITRDQYEEMRRTLESSTT
jgi:putative membrane protein